MHRLGAHHAEVETRRNLAGTLATLVEEPVYQFWPAGLEMVGADRVRRYYEHLFDHFIPNTRAYRLLSEWVSPESLAQEYEIQLEVEGAVETHRVMGILVASGELLGGERIYASEACMRRMLGDALLRELTPIAAMISS